MNQPCPSSGPPAGPPRPPAPAPVLTAVKLMYAGATVSAVCLALSLAVAIGSTEAAVSGRWLGHTLTVASVSRLRPLIVLAVVLGGLVVIALWLWLARANGQGRNWARTLSTVLLGLATLELANGLGRPAVHAAPVAEVLGVLVVLAWLPGLAAVWLLWRRDATAFFKPPGFARAGHGG